MTVMEVLDTYPDQESCIRCLEEKRWGDKPECPYCCSQNVARKKENDLVGRWNCHDCKSSFNVLSKTIFHQTRIPLQKWFAAIALLLNAKKSISSHQLARDLGLNKATAWRLAHQVRMVMEDREQGILLRGIVEADETFVGAKAKRWPDKELRSKAGVEKMTYLGAVERDGRVVVGIADGVTKPRDKKLMDLIPEFIESVVDKSNAKLISDGFRAYNPLGKIMSHYTAKHKEKEPLTTDIDVHTNTIEGFWTWIKRAWYGTHHHYTRRYAPLYIAEAAYKYNCRKDTDLFGNFLRRCFPVWI